jgi:hypothetical protein
MDFIVSLIGFTSLPYNTIIPQGKAKVNPLCVSNQDFFIVILHKVFTKKSSKFSLLHKIRLKVEVKRPTLSRPAFRLGFGSRLFRLSAGSKAEILIKVAVAVAKLVRLVRIVERAVRAKSSVVHNSNLLLYR